LPLLSEWAMSDDVRIATAVASKTRKIWESLALFFRTKGYILFVAEPLEKEHAQGLYPAGKFRDNLELDLEPPFARCTYHSDQQAYFTSLCFLLIYDCFA